jgi:hypothetical protein
LPAQAATGALASAKIALIGTTFRKPSKNARTIAVSSAARSAGAILPGNSMAANLQHDVDDRAIDEHETRTEDRGNEDPKTRRGQV